MPIPRCPSCPTPWARAGAAGSARAEAGTGDTRGAVMGRAKLVRGGAPRLEGLEVIWRQAPKVTGRGHYSHRLTFSPDGKYLFVASGERQKMTPAQEMDTNLGKVLRLLPDGKPAPGNPFADKGGVNAEIWSLGHRNIQGAALHPGTGELWTNEHGPKGGDEVNLVAAKANYGYPIVSNGDHYDGKDIPDHPTRPEFAAPKLWWNPSVSPAGLVWYDGDLYPGWKNSLLMGALSGKGLIRMGIDGDRLTDMPQNAIQRQLELVVIGHGQPGRPRFQLGGQHFGGSGTKGSFRT